MPFFYTLGNSESVIALYEGILNKPWLTLLSYFGTLTIFNKTDQLLIKTTPFQKALSIFFCLCTWLSSIYKAGLKTVDAVLINNPIALFYSLLYLISFFFIIETLQKIITFLYNSPLTLEQCLPPPLTKVTDFFYKRIFLSSFIFLLVIYSLIAISAYPAVFMGDSLDQIMQFLAYDTKSAAHPVLSSMFIGSFVKLGLYLNNANLGLFFYSLVQVSFLAFTMALSLYWLAKITTQRFYLFIVLILYALLPSIQGTMLLATKDIVFSGFFLLYLVPLIIYFDSPTIFQKYKLSYVYMIAILGMMLFRYNTLYFLILTLFLYLLMVLFRKIKLSHITTILTLTSLAIIGGYLVNSFLVAQYVETQPKPNRREMLSIPFQHTARFIRYHDDTISDSDKEVINAVLDYGTLKTSYNPYRSDPVKRTHNEAASSGALIAYFKLVAKQAQLDPLLAFESLAVSHANLFNLDLSMNTYYNTSLVMNESRKKHLMAYDEIGFKEIPFILKMNKARITLYSLWDRLPVLSQLNHYATYIFLLFSMFAIYLKERKHIYLLAFFPLIAFLGTLILGPITIGYIRYILPLIINVPLLFCVFLNSNTSSNKPFK